MKRIPRIVASLILLAGLFLVSSRVNGAELAMGFRVGEVTSDSVIVWSRVTTNKTRNADGEKMVGRPKTNDPSPDQINVDALHGATPGADGELRATWSTNKDLAGAEPSAWQAVAAKGDYTHQFHLKNLRPATKYYLKVEARSPGGKTTATQSGSFVTAAKPDQWQDVSFSVITGQAYRDLDDPQGYRIYPSMGKLGLKFLVSTGDTVYYDSERPKARTVPLARYHWHRMYSLPRVVEFHRLTPGYWEKDDHDTLSNDSWPTMNPKSMLPLTWKDGLRLFREQVPMGEKTHRTIRWGKGLQIWMVEGRDFRSSNRMPDGPEKTIWGKEQMAWLKKSVLESDADFRVLISPTPIVGPDRSGKSDNHANKAFAFEGNHFRDWTKEQKLKNFFVCCGDRHWQYMSVDPKTGLREFSCGPASDEHAGGTPGHDPKVQPFHKVQGGFLTVNVYRKDDAPRAAFRFHDVRGKVVYEHLAR
ncbi:MAG: alkaline phosphatase D family protein [Planctomycetales bacterium]